MKTGNRLCALLLAAVMVFGLLPAAALAAADEAVMAETPLGEEAAEAALSEVPEAAEEPSAAAELSEAGMKEQTSDGLTVSFVKYTGYEGFGETRTEVEKDDLTLVAAKIQWTAVDGATGYTVTVSSTDDTRTFTDSGNDRCVWQQDNTARTARITNLYPGKTYTVTVRALGTGDNGSMTFTTKTATNALAEIAAADPEAPAAWGALPDDNQLTYHDSELAAFIHYGPNTFNNRSWGTGAESPSDFAPTALDQDVVDGWVKQFKDAGFQRLIFVAKHHDGFCLWFSDYTEHDLDAADSGYHYDLLEQVSKACTKYDMDMGFYISPWDAYETPGTHNPDGKYGTEAYNEHYLNTLREVLDSKANGNKYGNNGKFVEVWMDGAKGSNVQQANDFDTWFQLIHELQPECAIFSPRSDGGIRWVGNEGGYSGSNESKDGKGDISWQKVNPKNQVVSDTLTHNICDPGESPRFPRQYGKPDGVLWSVNECDVSIESEWFWHSGNTLRTMDALSTMYFETVGYGSPFLLNVPPTTTGSFATASANRLAEFGREVRNSFADDLAAGKTATAGSTRASEAAGKFGAANVVDTDPDNYWTMDDAAWTAWAAQSTKTPGAEGSASVTVELGETKTFDVISVQEFIPLGQRIISGVAEYRDADGNWQEFGTFHTVGARRLIRSEPVNGNAVRVTINESYAVPLIRSIGVYKVTRAMALGDGIPAGMTYVDDQAEGQIQYSSSGWTKQADDSTSINKTKTYARGAASFTYTFTGSKIYVMGIKDTANGKFEVKIDDGEWAEVNTADTTARITKTVLWASEDLAAGEHTISVKWKSGWFDFDGLCYLPASTSVLEFEKAEYTVFPSSSVDLKVKRSGDTSGEVTFKFSDQPGTAIQGDYVQMGETYTMAPGETEKVITMHTTAGAVSGGSPIGKNFYGILADPTGAILGFTTETTVTIVDPDSVPQTPKGETYTTDDPFQLPSVVGKSRKLEGEYMVLDGTEATPSTSYVRISTDANASNGKKIGWFEPGNKVILHYNAPQAGVYTVTLRYQSGRPTDSSNDNKVNWRGQNVEAFSGTIPGLGGNGSNYGEHSYQLTVTEAGPGSIEFYADASACPNIDWITFRLNPPTTEDPGEIVVPDGLLGYWTFDGDTREEQLTSKVNGLTATTATGVTLADSDLSDGSGGGVQFNGANAAYLTLNLTGDYALTTARSFSVGGWIKHTDWATSTSSQQIPSVFHSGGGQAILAFQHNNTDTGRFSSYLGGTNTFDTRGIKLDTWCHVMLVYTKEGDTSSLRFYVNGVASEAVNVSAPNFNVSGADQNLVGKILVGAHRNGSEPSLKAIMDEIRYYNRAITADEVETIYEKDKPPVPPLAVTVDPETELRQISPAMFGINHRYHNDGYGSWDKANAKIYDAFQTLCEQASFGSVRYPGGTVANLFTWKDAIGPVADRTPTIAGNNFYTRANQAEVGGADPVDPVFGVDEAMTWIYDDLNAEAIFVYGLGRGDPDDAAELVEYLNAPATEEYPWAMKRAANGHPEPYGVTKFEIGNEFSDIGQRYWMEGKPSGANDVDLYIDGGIMTIDGTRNQYNGNPLNYVVRKGDWRPLASKSKGEANEVYYVCYTPVVAGSAHVKVAGTEWTIVDSLEGQAADAQVCTFNDTTGEIQFGDGIHGAIPALDARITCDYQTRQAGFVDYYNAMKAVAADIGVEIEIYSGIVDRQQQSFISKMNEKGFNDKYDGVIYHPYSGGGQCSYAASLTKEKEYAATIGTLKRAMDATGDTTKEVAVSEFGINANNDYVASMGNAIYTANHLIDCVNAGAAYLNRHCLVDFTTGDNLGNWQQSVIQCHRQSDGTYRYVATPSAHVFQLFNTMTGHVEVDQAVTGNADYIGATVQTVNIYSTKDADGTVYVLIVNNDESNETTVQLGVKDVSLSGKTIEVKYLTSDAVLDQNTLSEPNKVRVQTAQAEVAEGAEVLTYAMRPHSIYAFRIPGAAQPVDTTALEAAITDANTAKQGVQTIDGKTEAQVDKGVKFVTAAEMKALTDAIAAAEEARDAENKTDESVAAAVETLNAAVETFNNAIRTGVKSAGTVSGGGSFIPPSKTETETKEDGTKVTTETKHDGTTIVTTETPDGDKEVVETKKDGTVTATTETSDGAKAVVETKPDGSKTQTVEQADGTKSELVATKDGDVTITVTDPEGEELVKTEIPAEIPEPETKFEDVTEAAPWAEEAIDKVAGLKLVEGTGDNKYSPVISMTRGSLATVLHRLSQGKTDYEHTFQDVADGKYYTEGVAWAAKAGVVTGYTAETFAPEDTITREQLAVMLARYAKLVGLNTKADAKALEAFTDGDTTGTWAVDGMAWCVANGILKGKGQNDLDPTADVTRAEVAVMLDRFIALLK